MRMYFLDSTDGEKYEYNQHGFARFHNQIIGSGVSDVNSLEVSAKTNMDVGVGAGWIFSNGFSLELEKSETLTHDISDPNNDRIDRVIIRFDTNPEERRFYPVILKGTPSSNPTPPSLTRDNYIQEMSLAQVRIIAGKSFIEQSQITDERADDAVCGYIPLHNIYRGLSVNELGMVTMPNQSYIEMFDETDITIGGGSNEDGYVITKVPISPNIDRQSEVINGIFYPKSEGVFNFDFLISMDNSVDSTMKIQAFIKINENSTGEMTEDNVFLFSKPGIGGGDFYFSGSGTKYLKKGDKVEVEISTIRFNGDKISDYRRLTITKSS